MVVKMSTKFLKISMERDIQLNNVELVDLYKEAEANKQIKLPSSAIDHKILFKEKLQRRESKLPVP